MQPATGAAQPSRRLRDGMLVDPRVALPLIVAISTVAQLAINRAMTLPTVFGDELIYSNLGKSLARSGRFLLRGHTDVGHSLVYPLLISPAYALAGNGVDAFMAIKLLNAFVMSLAAIPTYFLARRVVSNPWSLLAAALTVAVPWFTFTTSVMTESLFYPLYTAFALVVVRALERPTRARQLASVGMLAVLVGTRWQAIALAPAIATAVVVYGWSAGRLKETLRAFALTWILFGLGALAVVASRATGGSPLGAYEVLARGYNPLSLAKWAAWNIADLELALGVVAVAALPLALAGLLRREARTAEQALGSVVVALPLWTLASVATLSASTFGLGRLHERSLFYVVPLFIVCFVYWLAEGMRRPTRLTWAVAAVVLALPLLLPARFIRAAPTPDALATIPWERLSHRLPSLPVVVLIAPLLVLAVLTFALGRSRLVAVAWLVLAFAMVGLVHARHRGFQPNVSRLAWIDATLPRDSTATLIYVAPPGTCPTDNRISTTQLLVTFSEFFNRSVDNVAHLGGPIVFDALPSDALSVGAGGIVLDHGRPLAAQHVAVPSRVTVAGRRIAVLDAGSPSSLTLWEARRPLRLVGYRPSPPICPAPS
jgi:hypothetical protein